MTRIVNVFSKRCFLFALTPCGSFAMIQQRRTTCTATTHTTTAAATCLSIRTIVMMTMTMTMLCATLVGRPANALLQSCNSLASQRRAAQYVPIHTAGTTVATALFTTTTTTKTPMKTRVPTRLFSSNKVPSLDSSLPTHTVTWQTADGVVSFQAVEGETLRTAALRRGLVSPHNGRSRLINCRGLGTCGTCAVEIDVDERKKEQKDDESKHTCMPNNVIEPPSRNNVEQLRLSLPPHNNQGSPRLRLACQVQVYGSVTVTKRTGFWGQYDGLANKSEAETYFGDWEYLLDNKSPSVERKEKDEK